MQINTMQPEKGVICTACKLKFSDVPTYKLHRSTEFHLYNSKRQIAELDPVTEEQFEQKRAMIQTSVLSVSMETMWKCLPCGKRFKTLDLLEQHKKQKNHKRKEKEYIVKHPEVSGSDLFKSIQVETSTDNFLSDLAKSLTSGGDRIVEEDDLSAKALPTKTTLESQRICLFCNLESEGVKKNIDHMRLFHNFVILDIECLINLKGILNYIAERIQLGKICLYCDKQFSSADRCQQHMTDKGHCMMSMDADEEFEPFYDFSRAYKGLIIPRTNENTKAISAEEKKGDSPKKAEVEEVSSEEWEECDIEDGYEVIEEEKIAEDFSVIDTSVKKDDDTKSFEVIGDSHSSIKNDDASATDSIKSFIYKNSGALNKGKRGKTRKEAFEELNAVPAEIMSTGELRLPSGKIIGHRKFKNIYKQRAKLPDDREQVVINKLALEYRQMMSGELVVAGSYRSDELKQLDKYVLKHIRRAQHNQTRIHLANNMTKILYFKDQSLIF